MSARERFAMRWLALREPVDHRSRSSKAVDRLRRCGLAAPRRVLDLGAGTGSNLRWLGQRLESEPQWILLDHDLEVLRAVAGMESSHVWPLCGDLSATALDLVAHVDLVTCSALLDLASERWLSRLVAACAAARVPALLALGYDGRMRWEPADDPSVRAAVNGHQLRDKGTGAALGPRATRRTASLFERAGYRTRLYDSAWRLDAGDAELAGELVEGWLRAACEQEPASAADFRRWAEERRAMISARRFLLTVGHEDLLAVPAERWR